MNRQRREIPKISPLMLCLHTKRRESASYVKSNARIIFYVRDTEIRIVHLLFDVFILLPPTILHLLHAQYHLSVFVNWYATHHFPIFARSDWSIESKVRRGEGSHGANPSATSYVRESQFKSEHFATWPPRIVCPKGCRTA